MGEGAATELEEGLAELERICRAGRPPTRYHARAVLVPLGRLLLEGEGPGTRDGLERLRRAVEPTREAWEAAVEQELALAIAEHVLGVDPRHLGNPRFDFEYAVAARERLEARLSAALALDLAPSEESLDRIAAADRLLAPYLEGQTRPPSPPGAHRPDREP
jgi:hypothetical protein